MKWAALMRKRIRNRVLFLLTEKERREKRRIKRAELVRSLNLTPNTVSSWMNDDVTKFEDQVVIKWCEYFNCKLEDLIYISDEDDNTEAAPNP